MKQSYALIKIPDPGLKYRRSFSSIIWVFDNLEHSKSLILAA